MIFSFKRRTRNYRLFFGLWGDERRFEKNAVFGGRMLVVKTW